MGHDGLKHLLHPFVAEIGAAQHQQRRNRPGKEVAEHQGRGEQDQELVAQRTRCDLPDNGKFALRLEPDHVTGRDGGIVDDDTCRLRTRFGSLAGHIIEGRCSHLGDTSDIVEKADQPDTHRSLLHIIGRVVAGRTVADWPNKNPARSGERAGSFQTLR